MGLFGPKKITLESLDPILQWYFYDHVLWLQVWENKDQLDTSISVPFTGEDHKYSGFLDQYLRQEHSGKEMEIPPSPTHISSQEVSPPKQWANYWPHFFPGTDARLCMPKLSMVRRTWDMCLAFLEKIKQQRFCERITSPNQIASLSKPFAIFIPTMYDIYYLKLIEENLFSMAYRQPGLREKIRLNAVKAIIPDDSQYVADAFEAGIDCYLLPGDVAKIVVNQFSAPLP